MSSRFYLSTSMPGAKNITCLSFNAQGIKSKIDHLTLESSHISQLLDFLLIC